MSYVNIGVDVEQEETQFHNCLELHKTNDSESYENENENNDEEIKTENNGKPRVAIIGNGNFGKALATLFQNASLDYCIGSRSPIAGSSVVVSVKQAIINSEIIFLCLPVYAHAKFSVEHSKVLEKKVVVDVSNLESSSDDCNALKLQKLLPKSYVVKALNTISAYSMENDFYGCIRDTYICGNNNLIKDKLCSILREIGVNPIDKGSLNSAILIERLSLQLFPNWYYALFITLLTLIPILLYVYLRLFWFEKGHNKDEMDGIPLYQANIVISWLTSTLIAVIYLANAVAGFFQLYKRTKYFSFPPWLDKWMKCRKQLGLISLLLGGVHGCISCLLIGSGDLKYLLNTIYIPVFKHSFIKIYQGMNWVAQLSMLFGVFAFAIMSVMGITSISSVSAQMSWREWRFIQSHLGFLCLVLTFGHIICQGYKFWNPNYIYGWRLWKTSANGVYPYPIFVMGIFPLVVIILKLVLMIPFIARYLEKIRNGRIDARIRK
ncbi:metalloreductase STEAP4 [Hydra vulgaris]|uniref:Metalloreductase STEAP4 n=1 Tax=Hydra vulgaris TaxID=6087 RepID=T2MBI2_HYDVU|nr:metalloreductase STEAP4-like [Hydra vulgaris]